MTWVEEMIPEVFEEYLTTSSSEGLGVKRLNLVAYTNSYKVGPMTCSAWTEEAWVKHRSQLVVRLKAIENTMGFSLLLFFQPPLRTSDLLTDQEVTRSKEVILSGGNELADLICSSPIGFTVVAFEEVSWIGKLCKNEFTLEMAQMEAICHVTWAHMPTPL